MSYISTLIHQNRELNSGDLITCQRAVMSLCDYLHDPEHMADAIREGMHFELIVMVISTFQVTFVVCFFDVKLYNC